VKGRGKKEKKAIFPDHCATPLRGSSAAKGKRKKEREKRGKKRGKGAAFLQTKPIPQR